MKLDLLHKLKRKLSREADLSKIWSFYMDHFADLPEFIEEGEPVRHPFLEAVVPQICQQMFGRTIAIAGLMPIYIAEYQFVHAPFQAEGRPGGAIYFEDIKIGLIAVSEDFPLSDAVKYSRFSQPIQLQSPNRYDYN